ncbi:phenylacetate--CoA ligase family protein [Confluentibacter lentus]|uniref:phenylacetate--CoA ligase family protein n=1 Tax=Confluentibacter lentus TaxID=1699412 RepID=UPI000C2945F3|nr:phenylacetate--CoA ligase family protein [Confluentibacter lentus]
MFTDKIRKNVFWILDSLKGNKIKKHYEEIAYLNGNKNITDIQERRSVIISNLLGYATETTPFYKKFKGIDELEKFPILKKTIIQENFNAFKSESYLNKPYKIVSTSGSTGIPFILHQSSNKEIRNMVDVLFFCNKANFSLGERLYMLQVWGNNYQMDNKIKSWKQNSKQINVSNFNDDEIKKFLKSLQKYPFSKNIISTVSALENICEYIERMKLGPFTKLKINSIIAISESLSDYTKLSLKKHFNVDAVSRYSNEELGIIAQQYPGKENSNFNINWASYHVEILKMDSDESAEPGELGRIIVTDLFNYCMPIIRYDTGDISCFESSEKDAFPTLKKIEGRKMDLIYNTKGGIFSSFLVDYVFFDYFSWIKQYQFIQVNESEYHIKLNTHSGYFNYEKDLIDTFKKNLGDDATVKIFYVNEIPLLSSRKRKKIMNLYHNN